jgi:3-mercaptopyruvate sulfurtransferase SseA
MIQRWLGYQAPRNYDGSWWEWASRDELPVDDTKR